MTALVKVSNKQVSGLEIQYLFSIIIIDMVPPIIVVLVINV